MELSIIKYKSFEKYIQEVLKVGVLENNCLLNWEEHKARYVFKGKSVVSAEIFKGQVIDITGLLFNRPVFIEVKETTLNEINVNSYLRKNQKEYLKKASETKGHLSIVLLYFHKSQNIYALKYPLKKKVISFNEEEDVSKGIIICQRANCMFGNIATELGRLIWV